MRHGRKSRSRVINGFKRHIARELDHGLILAVSVRPANEAEHKATEGLREQIEAYAPVEALHIDRGYLAAEWTQQLFEQGGLVVGKPWTPQARGGRFSKRAFAIDLVSQRVTCPAGQVTNIRGARAPFRADECDPCSLREQCTRSQVGRGRSVAIHPQEAMMQQLHARQLTADGRQELRERTQVEHGLAHICRIQGRRARYRGVRKNEFDVRRAACIVNLHAASRLDVAA